MIINVQLMEINVLKKARSAKVQMVIKTTKGEGQPKATSPCCFMFVFVVMSAC